METEKSKSVKKYVAIHMWIKLHYGKANHCSIDKTHKGKRYEWANISGEYKRDIKDFVQLCPSCHRKMDYDEVQRLKNSKSHRNQQNSNFSKVQQCLNGELIAEFKALFEASQKTGIIRTSIQNNIAGRSKSAGGYQWKYI